MAKSAEIELREYRDRTTGRNIRQLTDHRCHSHHLYFTNPGWFTGRGGEQRLLFGSDRFNRTNLFSVDLAGGSIEQHTDADMPRPPHETSFLFASLSPTRPECYFWRGRDLIAVNLHDNRERLLYTAPADYAVNMTNVSADGRFVHTAIYEDLSNRFSVDLLNGYVGFGEYSAARPTSIVLGIPTDGGAAREIFREQYWIGHVNTSPTKPNLLSYCHEGPWGKVDNRIWCCDTATGRTWAVRQRRSADEVVGHEYWHADGIYLGYHGESRRSNAAGKQESVPGSKTFGRIRFDDTGNEEVTFPHETGHIHSNDYSMVVGDGQGSPQKVIRLWRWNGSGFDGPRILCEHRGSFQVQQLHVHPRFSPDGTKVVFASDRTGYGQVYEIEVGDWDSLPML